jgi:F0F1-type ATP synthase assembly protein I
MIAELFYPKELKEVIKDLREKDDLNEEALKNINKSFLATPLIITILVTTPIYLIDGFNFFCWLFIVTSIVGYVFSINQTTKKMILPYSLGIPMQGKIESIEYRNALSYGSAEGWSFNYSFMNLKNEPIKKSVCNIRKSVMTSPAPEVGNEITVYVYPDDGQSSMPLIPSTFKQYCISKSKLKSTLTEE